MAEIQIPKDDPWFKRGAGGRVESRHRSMTQEAHDAAWADAWSAQQQAVKVPIESPEHHRLMGHYHGASGSMGAVVGQNLFRSLRRAQDAGPEHERAFLDGLDTGERSAASRWQ